jgi:hypothetical protein
LRSCGIYSGLVSSGGIDFLAKNLVKALDFVSIALASDHQRVNIEILLRCELCQESVLPGLLVSMLKTVEFAYGFLPEPEPTPRRLQVTPGRAIVELDEFDMGLCNWVRVRLSACHRGIVHGLAEAVFPGVVHVTSTR